jgi:hypothetical protein
MIFSSTNTRPMNPHMSNVAQIQTPYRVVVLPHFDSKLAKVELIISHLKRSLRCHDWLSFFFFFANQNRAVFFLQHSLWYYSKRRCNIRERSAITPERKVGNACGMAKNPRRLPLLAVLSVARGKTRKLGSLQGQDSCVFAMNVSTFAGGWLNRDTRSRNGGSSRRDALNQPRSLSPSTPLMKRSDEQCLTILKA